MNFSIGFLTKGATWTAGGYLAAQLIRFATNIALTRILTPEVFGLMVVVNGIRTGIDLLMDVGIGQSVVRDKHGDSPDFYNSAWTLQILRGVVVTVVCAAAAIPLAAIFEVDLLSSVLPIVSLNFLLLGFGSVARFILRRRLQFVRLNLFDLGVQVLGSAALLGCVYASPTVWGLVWGSVLTSILAVLASFFLIPNMIYRLVLVRRHVVDIVSLGKWIFLSSTVYFLSMNFDRLYLAKLIPLDLLGVYGLARGISELLSVLFIRIGNDLIFPLIATAKEFARHELKQRIGTNRAIFLALAAILTSVTAAWVDLPFRYVFDARYHAAADMLSILILGTWFSLLCVLGESSLLGFGKPGYSTLANILKFCYLVVVLPLALRHGMLVMVVTFSISDLLKYIVVTIGTVRERFNFIEQDALFTLATFAIFFLSQYARIGLGIDPSVPQLFAGSH